MPISCHNLRPKFLADDAVQASCVWGQSLDWQHGEKILLVAPSSAGKTTLVHILYGIRGDYGGEVLLDGRKLRELDAEDWASVRQRQLAIVFQQLRLFSHLTAEQNIQIKADLACESGTPSVTDMAESLGIGKVLTAPCARLSLGEQQRVAIIRALVQPFDWLLLDEPFSHLDAATSRKAVELVHKVCELRQAGFVLTALADSPDLSVDRTMVL